MLKKKKKKDYDKFHVFNSILTLPILHETISPLALCNFEGHTYFDITDIARILKRESNDGPYN